MDSSLFKTYPVKIESRDQGVFFEVGDGCLYEWFHQQGWITRVVYRWGSYDVDKSENCLKGPEIFRRDKQRNLLVRDKHSDMFDDANEAERERLAKMCFGT
jgi:hypothetical protein